MIVFYIAYLTKLAGQRKKGIQTVQFGLGKKEKRTVIFIVAMWTMQDSWRVGIAEKDSTALVTRGIYQVSRNPAFLGFDLVCHETENSASCSSQFARNRRIICQ